MQCDDDEKKKSLSFGIMLYCLSPALFLLDEALCSAQHGCRQDICMKATQTKMENGESETLQGSRVRLFFGCTRTQKSGTLEVIAISRCMCCDSNENTCLHLYSCFKSFTKYVMKTNYNSVKNVISGAHK